MKVTLHFQYNFNFSLSTLPSINTSTFLSHNFQCNFKFFFFLGSLVKTLCLIIISFYSLICVQLTKTTLNLKRREKKKKKINYYIEFREIKLFYKYNSYSKGLTAKKNSKRLNTHLICWVTDSNMYYLHSF